MTPIHALVFSKNRAMQLDAFLRSAKKHAPYASIIAMCAFTNGDHEDAYIQAMDEHPEMQGCWAWDDFGGGTIEDQVRHTLKQHERVVFHTDDEIFYRTPPADLLDNDQDIIMLRQGRNTTYCHPLDCEQEVPAGFPRWRWRDAQHDFGYPLSLNATIYRSEWITPLLDFHFNNPTQLEAALACHHNQFTVEYAVAAEHSCTVALPHNVVSVDSNCPRGGNPEWQPDALCQKYRDGWRIDLDAMDFSNITAAHQEVPLEFYKP